MRKPIRAALAACFLLSPVALADEFQPATVLRTDYGQYLVNGTSYSLDVIELQVGEQVVTVNWRPVWAFGRHAASELVVGTEVLVKDQGRKLAIRLPDGRVIKAAVAGRALASALRAER